MFTGRPVIIATIAMIVARTKPFVVGRPFGSNPMECRADGTADTKVTAQVQAQLAYTVHYYVLSSRAVSFAIIH